MHKLFKNCAFTIGGIKFSELYEKYLLYFFYLLEGCKTEAVDIKNQTKRGIMWMGILTIIAIPIQFATSIVLGRISPDILGEFGFIDLFFSTIVTFLFFGGDTVVIKFLPEIKKEKRISFIISYGLIVTILYFFSIVFLKVLNISPKFILGQDFPENYSFNLFILGIIYLIFYLVTSSLNGLIHLKESTILQKLINVFNLLYFSLYFVLKDYYKVDEWALIINGTLFIIILITLYSLFFIKRAINFNEKKYFYLPKKFWQFGIFVHLSTLSIYIYEKLDQLVIVNMFNIKLFGIYYACFKVAYFVKFVPQIINKGLFPTLSTLVANKNDKEAVLYNEYNMKMNIVFGMFLALPIILFSKEILLLYGKEYTEYSWILTYLAYLFFISIPSQINGNLLNAKGKSNFFFINSICTILLQILILFYTINRFGLVSLLISRGCAIIMGTILTYILLKRIEPRVKMNTQYYFYCSILLVLVILSANFNINIRLLILVICFILIIISNFRLLSKMIRRI